MSHKFAKLAIDNVFIPYEDKSYTSFHDQLPPDIYKLEIKESIFGRMPYFKVIKQDEKLVRFKNGVVKHIINTADNFFNPDTIDKYKTLDVPHKMGLILYGPPGTGKTCTATLIMKELVEKYDAICLNYTGVTLYNLKSAINTIRLSQKNPIVIFYDEIDAAFNAQELDYLTFLDGESQFNNLIVLGCTNKIGNIPDRIINRKSRIKHCIEITSFPIAVYEDYVKKKMPLLDNEIVAKIAFKAEEACLTIDQLKHVLIDFYVDGTEIEPAIENVKKTIKVDEEDHRL